MTPFAEGIWLDIAPARILGMRLTATMTVLRLRDGSLLLHSPLAVTPERRAAVEELGSVANIYAPSLSRSRALSTRQRQKTRTDREIRSGSSLVYSSAPEQQLSFWFRISKVETLPVAEMWGRYKDRLGIGREDYEAYFTSAETATGLHVGEIHRLKPVRLAEIQRAVEGFVPPQGMISFRDEFGRYEKLLSKLSDPLPKDVFPQLTLELGAVQTHTP